MQASTNIAFDSHTYGYTLTLPASSLTEQARKPWNGRANVSSDSPQVDQFSLPTSAQLSSWGVAAPWKRNLAAYTTFLIAWTHRYHGDTCPTQPQTRSQVTIGDEPGVLLEYNCGILINVAAAVHNGIGYWFGLRDLSVHAATDPTDRTTFLRILKSVQFPS